MLIENKKNWIKKDKIFRKIFLKNEIKKVIVKSLLYNRKYKFLYKLSYDNLYKNFSYKSSISMYRTCCMFLSNNKSIFKKFKLSRHISKNLASHGFLIGFKKSSF